jgi:hypothetical protein
VYFCPLIYNGIHFSLLEINELNKKIYYYDFMAPKHIIAGYPDNSIKVCKVACTEFNDLKFVYDKAINNYYNDASNKRDLINNRSLLSSKRII